MFQGVLQSSLLLCCILNYSENTINSQFTVLIVLHLICSHKFLKALACNFEFPPGLFGKKNPEHKKNLQNPVFIRKLLQRNSEKWFLLLLAIFMTANVSLLSRIKFVLHPCLLIVTSVSIGLMANIVAIFVT